MGFTTLSLKGRALRLLSQREHSRSELAAKLAPHAESPEELAALLDLLVEQDWLSDKRAAQSLVHRRGPRLGAARLVRELRNRGVADELVREATAPLLATASPSRSGRRPSWGSCSCSARSASRRSSGTSSRCT